MKKSFLEFTDHATPRHFLSSSPAELDLLRERFGTVYPFTFHLVTTPGEVAALPAESYRNRA